MHPVRPSTLLGDVDKQRPVADLSANPGKNLGCRLNGCALGCALAQADLRGAIDFDPVEVSQHARFPLRLAPGGRAAGRRQRRNRGQGRDDDAHDHDNECLHDKFRVWAMPIGCGEGAAWIRYPACMAIKRS